MKFEQISALVGDVPYISRTNARFLYDLILRERLTNILELGIGHGTATCHIAAALEEIGEGHVTSVDLIETEDLFKPSAEEQLQRVGLQDFVTIRRMQSGYNWFLHDEIVRQTSDDVCREIYDLCIIDGPKNWTIDGAAFFMVDKLLKTDGWIVFDDYNWTYGEADTRREATDGITHRSLSEEERATPHVRDIFEYLVKQHPDYGRLLLLKDSDWAVAQKIQRNRKTYTIRHRGRTSSRVIEFVRKLAQRFT